LFSKDETWKIADFGFSTDGQENGWVAAEDPQGMGTSGYRAPELIREDDQTFNNKSDIWAFGCIVYEVITSGEKLFHSDWSVREYAIDLSVSEEYVARMRDRLIAWMNSMVGNIQHPEWVLTTLLKTIDVDPSTRPTATELKGVLHEVLKAGRTTPATQRASRRVILRREATNRTS
jgi:serine/threonine protein kinase